MEEDFVEAFFTAIVEFVTLTEDAYYEYWEAHLGSSMDSQG